MLAPSPYLYVLSRTLRSVRLVFHPIRRLAQGVLSPWVYGGDLKVWLKRVGWLILIWSASVLTLAAVAYALKLFMGLIGLQVAG